MAIGVLIMIGVSRLVRSSAAGSDFAESNYTVIRVALVTAIVAMFAVAWLTSAGWLADGLFIAAAPAAAMANVVYRRRRGSE